MIQNYGPLTPKAYRPRLIEAQMDRLLKAFGCVVISGPKWCGKTWTALTRAQSVTKLDIPAEREAALVDPTLALIGDPPHLVDEWQEVPEIWDASRRFVDETGNEKGLLLLTGSAALKKEERSKIRHSGTGRMGHVTMRPMSLAEMGISNGTVSLQDLFDGKEFEPVRRDTTIESVISWCYRGGWPANLELPDDLAAETVLHYVSTALSDNIMDEGRSAQTAQAVMRVLALNVSRAITNKTFLEDASNASGASMSEPTLLAYLDMLKRFFIIEEISGWEPPMRSKARVRVKPKRYFVDPSLAAALLNATPDRLLVDMQALGELFENLVMRDLQVYLSAIGGTGNALHYYRDEAQLEVDFILEHAGKWGAVEVKLSDSKAEAAAKNLIRLRDKMGANNAAQNPTPAFLAVIVGRGSLAYKRDDGIYVIPIATLTA